MVYYPKIIETYKTEYYKGNTILVHKLVDRNGKKFVRAWKDNYLTFDASAKDIAMKKIKKEIDIRQTAFERDLKKGNIERWLPAEYRRPEV